MRKGTKVIYNNQLYEVWEKRGNALKIYIPGSNNPELTFIITSIKNVKKP